MRAIATIHTVDREPVAYDWVLARLRLGGKAPAEASSAISSVRHQPPKAAMMCHHARG
jgi:hypothetical protein